MNSTITTTSVTPVTQPWTKKKNKKREYKEVEDEDEIIMELQGPKRVKLDPILSRKVLSNDNIVCYMVSFFILSIKDRGSWARLCRSTAMIQKQYEVYWNGIVINLWNQFIDESNQIALSKYFYSNGRYMHGSMAVRTLVVSTERLTNGCPKTILNRITKLLSHKVKNDKKKYVRGIRQFVLEINVDFHEYRKHDIQLDGTTPSRKSIQGLKLGQVLSKVKSNLILEDNWNSRHSYFTFRSLFYMLKSHSLQLSCSVITIVTYHRAEKFKFGSIQSQCESVKKFNIVFRNQSDIFDIIYSLKCYLKIFPNLIEMNVLAGSIIKTKDLDEDLDEDDKIERSSTISIPSHANLKLLNIYLPDVGVIKMMNQSTANVNIYTRQFFEREKLFRGYRDDRSSLVEVIEIPPSSPQKTLLDFTSILNSKLPQIERHYLF